MPRRFFLLASWRGGGGAGRLIEIVFYFSMGVLFSYYNSLAAAAILFFKPVLAPFNLNFTS